VVRPAPCSGCTRGWPRTRWGCSRCRRRRHSSRWPGKCCPLLQPHFMCDYDVTQSIGKRYRRQDEVGTPWCVTIDFDSLEDRRGDRAGPRQHRSGAGARRRACGRAAPQAGRGLRISGRPSATRWAIGGDRLGGHRAGGRGGAVLPLRCRQHDAARELLRAVRGTMVPCMPDTRDETRVAPTSFLGETAAG
jgi:hypothetical protein